MNILITGAGGFLGSSFIKYLFSDISMVGGNVRVIALLKKEPREERKHADKREFQKSLIKNFAQNSDRLIIEVGSITERKFVIPLLEKHNINVIIHCAAISNVGFAEKHKEITYNINVHGTQILAECANQYASMHRKIMAFCFNSTALVHKTREDNKLPYYAQTKLLAEQTLYDKSSLDVFIIRIPNMMGAYHYNPALLMNLIINILCRKEISIYTDVPLINYFYTDSYNSLLGSFLSSNPFQTKKEVVNISGDAVCSTEEITKIVCEICDELGPELKMPKSCKLLIQKRKSYEHSSARFIREGLSVDACFRNFRHVRDLKEMVRSIIKLTAKEHNAAAKIQANIRGYLVRKSLME
jgi:dTDP-glucose 4,6-dehydratase